MLTDDNFKEHYREKNAYINAVYIPDMWGHHESERLWCYRVEVRETQANMAFREGHREWNEDLFA